MDRKEFMRCGRLNCDLKFYRSGKNKVRESPGPHIFKFDLFAL